MENKSELQQDRCEACGLYKAETIGKCPDCGDIIDLEISGVCLSWKCRKCGYGVATTAPKLCVLDNGEYRKETYSQRAVCPYVSEPVL